MPGAEGELRTAKQSATMPHTPKALSPAKAERLPRKAQQMRQGGDNVGSPMPRILHVEDNPTVAACVRGFLSARECHVEHAASGGEALKKILAQPTAYDVVVMDYSMPELNGLECVRVLRQAGYAGRTVVFSSFLPAGVEREFLGLGVDRILYKSGDLGALLRVIQELRNRTSENENKSKAKYRRTAAGVSAADRVSR